MGSSTGSAARPTDDLGLQVDGVTVAFGGLVAVDRVSLRAPRGRITGLLGPNGAGKTTMFNACTGLNSPKSGRIELLGEDVSALAPQTRAAHGLGRTFQRMELFESQSVRQNVRVGREAFLAGRNPLRHIVSTRAQRAEIADAAEDSLALCGITDLGDVAVGSLSTGQRRLVELARVLTGPFHVLLLDEPSSGLDPTETERFGTILADVVKSRGVGILLVEHDMALVSSVCEFVYVMDFGKLIFEGTMLEALASPVVRAAYLGSTADAAEIGA